MSAKLFIRDDAGKDTEIEGELMLIFAATGEQMNVVSNALEGDGTLPLNAARWLIQQFMTVPGAPRLLGNVLAEAFDEWSNVVKTLGDNLTAEEFEARALKLLGVTSEEGQEVALRLVEPAFEDPRIE